MPERAPYRTIHHVLDHVAHDEGHPLVLERRPARYMFGLRNYGEFPHSGRNRADGDCFDGFCPGYATSLPTGRPYRVTGVLGVLWMSNGNHKIAVRVDQPGYSARRAEREIRRYATRYTDAMQLAGRWQSFGAPRYRGAGRLASVKNVLLPVLGLPLVGMIVTDPAFKKLMRSNRAGEVISQFATLAVKYGIPITVAGKLVDGLLYVLGFQ